MTLTDNSACREREPLLQAYIFGELSDESAADLERHLEVCDSCRNALAEGRLGMAALVGLEEAPFPYSMSGFPDLSTADNEEAWISFLEKFRIGVQGPFTVTLPRRNIFTHGPVAAAAALVIGIGLGSWFLPARQIQRPFAKEELVAEGTGLRVHQEAVDALARAEFLADLAIPYVNSVMQMWADIMDLEPERVIAGNLGETCAHARELIRDGRLLRRGLDPDRDEVFLAVVGRVELFLEEVASLADESETTSNLILLQETLRDSRLGDRLVSLDVNSAFVTALETSGWIGEEYQLSSEVRK